VSSVGLPLITTANTFSFSRDQGVFEWSGNSLFTIFCQPKRLLDTKMWRMLWDLLRFNACARRHRWDAEGTDLSVQKYLEREGYSDSFRDYFIIVGRQMTKNLLS